MSENQDAEPQHLTFAEAVKLAKTKPERGQERNDLLVKDTVLEPHWHWSREVGIPRDAALERARNVFFEQAILVGKETKLKEKKAKKEKPPVFQPAADAAGVAQPVPMELVTAGSASHMDEDSGGSSAGSVIRALPFAEVFLGVMSVVLYFFVRYTTFELLVLLVANLGLILASVAGRLFIGARGASAEQDAQAVRATA